MLRVMKIYSHYTGPSPHDDPRSPRDPDQRNRELSALLPLWPHELSDLSLQGRRRLVAVMERALRAERNRGRAGHWAYDHARHAGLYRAWVKERDALRALERCGSKTNGPSNDGPCKKKTAT